MCVYRPARFSNLVVCVRQREQEGKRENASSPIHTHSPSLYIHPNIFRRNGKCDELALGVIFLNGILLRQFFVRCMRTTIPHSMERRVGCSQRAREDLLKQNPTNWGELAQGVLRFVWKLACVCVGYTLLFQFRSVVCSLAGLLVPVHSHRRSHRGKEL